MTASSRGVLAATFAPGETAVRSAMRFTREVMTAWAATSVLPAAEQAAGELARQVAGEPFEIVWKHLGDAVQVELKQRMVPAGDPMGPTVEVEEWGITFASGYRVHWARLALPGALDRLSSSEWREESPRGPHWLGFLADASDLLAGTLDPDMVPAIMAQIVVPRLATWYAVYTSETPLSPLRLAYLWHTDETRIDTLREELATLVVPP